MSWREPDSVGADAILCCVVCGSILETVDTNPLDPIVNRASWQRVIVIGSGMEARNASYNYEYYGHYVLCCHRNTNETEYMLVKVELRNRREVRLA